MDWVTDEMEAAVVRLDDDLRKLGLYFDGHQFLETEDGGRFLIVDCLLGDVAFSQRIQQPQQHEDDRQIRKLETSYRSGEFKDAKERIARRLAEGKSPLGDD